MSAARWRPAVLWAVLIEALVLWPHPPEVPRGWTLEWLDFVKLDQVVHVALFAVLSIFVLRALMVEARPWWIAFVSGAAFGAFTELQQYFVPSRSMEFGDVLADVAGSAIGLAILAAWTLRRREFSR